MGGTIYHDFLDYRRGVDEIYREVRTSDSGHAETWHQFLRRRNELVGGHPQSALTESQKTEFKSLNYYGYSPKYRFLIPIELIDDDRIFEVELETDGLFRFRRLGKIYFDLGGPAVSLSIYWIMGYGGGVFLPFRDSTNKPETFGGGRYLMDTIKNVDLGRQGDRWVIDFNYAYNPSCAYNPGWHCPLAPQENWLSIPIEAGEKRFPQAIMENSAAEAGT